MIGLLLCALVSQNMYQATVSNVHDGDTATVTVIMDFNVAIVNRPIRFYDFDAWEITRTRTTVGTIGDDELAKGVLAKKDLEKILKSGPVFVSPREGGYDKYGRLLVKVYVKQPNGVMLDVGEKMKTLGHQRQ